ncbi:MAG: hypothetical protein RR782_07585 [Clostridium sp.]
MNEIEAKAIIPKEAVEGLKIAANKILHVLREMIQKLTLFINKYKKQILLSVCSNKRVVHLALYSKKARVRRKNMKKVLRIYERRYLS